MSADPTPTPDVIQLLQGHRSIRKFTDEPVSDEMVTEIIRSGTLSSKTLSILANIRKIYYHLIFIFWR